MDLDPREVVECGKVGPGEVLVVDTRRGEVIRNLDAKREVAGRRPYARWVARYMATLVPDPARVPPVHTGEDADPHRSGASATASRTCGWCSSRWAAPAPTRSGAWATTRRFRRSRRCRRASYAYFRQRFAQVTNPPIDSLREAMVMSLRMHLGPARLAAAGAAELRPDAAARAPGAAARGDGRAPERGGLLHRHARRGVGRDPRRRRAPARAHRPPPRGRAGGAARRAHPHHQRPRGGRAPRADPHAARDRRRAPAPGAHRAPRPGRARGRGGRRVRHPPLRHADRLRRRGGPPLARARDACDGLFGEDARAVPAAEREARGGARRRRRRRRALQFRTAAEKGLLKILSKMGISTLSLLLRRADLRGARPGPRGDRHLLRGHRVTASAASASRRSRRTCWPATRAAYPAEPTSRSPLPDHGRVRFRKEGEDHGWAPPVVVALQQAVQGGRRRTAYGGVPGQESAARPAGRPARPAGRPAGHAGPARRGRAGRGDPAAGSSPRPCRSARSRRRRTPRSPSR